MLDTFMENKFCQAHTPQPLGKDRDRFLYLINDIQNRKDDYAAQLSHLTLASMTNRKERNEDTRHEIITSLLGDNQAKIDKNNAGRQEALWQARLVLKIAEILDREEEELAQAFVQLEENESGLFERLKGEEDEEENSLFRELTKLNATMNKPRAGTITNRLKAWTGIAENHEKLRIPVWTTTRQEVADILFENYAESYKQQPFLVAEIQLPARTGYNSDQLLSILTELQDKRDEALDKFCNDLFAAETQFCKPGDLPDYLSEWSLAVNNHFPENNYGRNSARFYRFDSHLSRFAGLKTLSNEKSFLCVFTTNG